jgi:hypothetical protein
VAGPAAKLDLDVKGIRMPDPFPPPPDQPAPPGQGGSQPYGQPPARSYPQQELLPQEVRPGRSRLPLLIGLVAVLALIGGGVAAWLLLRDDGESTRASYCAAIKKAAPGGDITSALEDGPEAATASFRTIADLAPDSVADDWKTLTDLLASAQKSQSNVNLSDAISAFSALKSIVADSNDHCGTSFKVPSLP